MPARRPIGFPALLLILLATALPVRSQIPDEFTNLEILDPSISKDELVSTMRGLATSLGVRCNHCHVGPENLQGMDFASDEKETKRTARRMLTMVRAINTDHLQELPVVEASGRETHQTVACFTCHRGLPRPPRNLVDQLYETYREKGTSAALAELESLHQEHEGAGRYDFRPRTLDSLASLLFQQRQVEDARAVILANLEAHPDSADTHALLGVLEMRTGNREAAAAAFRRALEIDPDNVQAARGMAALAAAETPAEPENSSSKDGGGS